MTGTHEPCLRCYNFCSAVVLRMGGAGPYVEFDSKNATAVGGGGAGLVEEVYERAKPYLVRWKEELIAEHGYKDEAADEDGILLMAVSTITRTEFVHSREVHFSLPKTAEGFADGRWTRSFTSLAARRPNRMSRDLYLNEAPPLQNIFYLLQTIFDGMLSLVREDDLDDYGELITTRVLPRKEWIHEHSAIVKDVLGLTSTDQLEQDAERRGIIFSNRGLSYDMFAGDDSNSDGSLDYTACDAHSCGYCGKCPY